LTARRIDGRPRLIINYAKVIKPSQEGATIRETAEELGVSPASVHRILKAHRPVGGDLVPV
jgi:hypothetical protein